MCLVDWPDILRRILASLKEQITCTKMFFVAYSAAGWKAGLIMPPVAAMTSATEWMSSWQSVPRDESMELAAAQIVPGNWLTAVLLGPWC